MRKEMLKKSIGTIVMTIALVGTSIPGVTVSPVKVNADVATTVSASSNEVGKLESIFTTIDLMDASISELETAMEKGELTAEQLVQMYIDRINAYDKSLDLNSIITINSKALDEAKELDKERAAGKIKGKLHGIPIIVKDNYDVEGMPTSAGCKALKDSIAPDDSYAVKKLKEEGAIILAKANMSEFASSGRNSRSTLGGVVHNPYDVTRTPAGSSGGTAVAITSNFATAGLGTDTGSSVRAPSTMNNLFGLRVSLGLTSRDGIVPLSLDNDIAGPICKSAEDLAQVLSVISGTDENDTWTKESDNMKPENGYTSYLKTDGLKGKKIGYLQNSFGYYYNNKGEAVENPVEIADCEKGILETAKDNLVKGGAELVDMSDILPDSLIYQLGQNTSVGSVFEWDLNTYFASLGPAAPIKTVYELINNYKYGVDYTNVSVRNPAKTLAEMTDPRSLDSYKTAISNRLNFRNEINKILEENGIDAVMYVPYTQPANKEADSGNASYANSASYTSHFGPTAGLPDMSVPMGLCDTDSELGYDKQMPMSFNIFTSYGNDEELVEIAYGYEQTSGYNNIRTSPSTVPALEDKNVDKFLDELIDKTDSIDFSEYTVYPNGKVNVLLNKYAEATEVDRSDVYETYEATYDLAKAYDSLMNKLLANKKVTTPATDKTPTANTSTVTTPTIETVSAPAKAKISKITKAKKSMKIAIRKPAGVKGYQIKYSTSKKFVAKKTKTVTTSKATVTVKKINVKKTYYVKVRAYKLIDGKVTYGAYSKVKKVS